MKTLYFTDGTSIPILDYSEMHDIFVPVANRTEACEVWMMFNETNLMHVRIDDGIEVKEYDYYSLDGIKCPERKNGMFIELNLSPPPTNREKELEKEVIALNQQVTNLEGQVTDLEGQVTDLEEQVVVYEDKAKAFDILSKGGV